MAMIGGLSRESQNMLGLPYPNPAADLVYLNIQANSHNQAIVDVFDLQGRKLITQQLHLQSGSNTMTIRTAGLKGGAYFVRANVEGVIS